MNRNNSCQTNGWVKLPRKILSLPEYHEGAFDVIRCLLDLMLMAEWRESNVIKRRGHSMTILRGQLAVSEPGLAARWSVSRKRARSILNRLADEGFIRLNRVGKLQTIITLLDDSEQPQPIVLPASDPISQPTQQTEATPEATPEPIQSAEPNSILPAQQQSAAEEEVSRFFSEFFSEARQISREQVCRRFHLNEDRLAEHVRCIAEEWLLTDTHHRDYNDWARHIINTLNIRLRSGASVPTQNRYPATINNQNNNPFTNPTPEAYGYDTELADQTDPQGLQNLILSSNADSLNALQLPPGATWNQIVAVANASAAKRHNGDRYTTKAERDAEYAVYVQKKLAKAKQRQMDPDYDPFA